MAEFHVLTAAGGRRDIPAIRKIGMADLTEALREGWQDFWAKPSHLASASGQRTPRTLLTQ